jgi:AraC-like DNA-binding protein
MEIKFDNGTIQQTQWKLDHIVLKHSLVDYHDLGQQKVSNTDDVVRLHFGLHGDYDFTYNALKTSFELKGQHNNILYSDGLEMEVRNKSKQIETFGIEFDTDTFINIAQNGNDALKQLTEDVIKKKSSILSPNWRPNNLKIQQVIQEIIHCPYSDNLRQLFLLSKSIELLVLQAELYEQKNEQPYIKRKSDKEILFEAKYLLEKRLTAPPTINELAKLVGMNEYKLKKGFKELFGTTIFGYIHHHRMSLAKRLLLGTEKTAQEIAYETGYSSPQHFSKAFKKTFDVTPNSIRKNPDSTI